MSRRVTIAYLTDRILVGTGKKQKYGTQANLKDGKAVAAPIDDEEHVDERTPRRSGWNHSQNT